MGDQREFRISVVGGGLVGAYVGCLFAKRGFTVDIFERREDIRKVKFVQGRSINMALSVRGRTSLAEVDLEERVTQNGVPMFGRMIHDRCQGAATVKTRPILYGRRDQYIMSIDRRRLNEILLDGADQYNKITTYFEHKLVGADFETGDLTFEVKKLSGEKELKHYKSDLILGCDGANSAVRRQFDRPSNRFNFAQEFIEHGYMELVIPPGTDGGFTMAINYLHIWPRNEFMMIALPNPDSSYTVTLFMPFSQFESLSNRTELISFFRRYFADALPLIGENALCERFFSVKPLPLVSIKCQPYHYKDKFVLLGDAAHAMVPFYGQGMNAGLEDAYVLDQILQKHKFDFKKALPEYSQKRHVDAVAICDLALYNYIEMRSSVNSRIFLLRKKIDNFLHWLFPRSWIPLYTTVSFTRLPYHKCIANRRWQDRVIRGIIAGPWIALALLWAIRHYFRSSLLLSQLPWHRS